MIQRFNDPLDDDQEFIEYLRRADMRGHRARFAKGLKRFRDLPAGRLDPFNRGPENIAIRARRRAIGRDNVAPSREATRMIDDPLDMGGQRIDEAVLIGRGRDGPGESPDIVALPSDFASRAPQPAAFEGHFPGRGNVGPERHPIESRR